MIYDIILTEDRIFISDLRACKVFDRQGKFLCSVGERGRGPGQYTHISTLSIDNQNNKIYLYTINNSLYEYDFDGKFLRSINLPKIIDSGGLFSDCLYIEKLKVFCCTIVRRYGNEMNLIYFFNEKGELIDSLPNKYAYVSEGKYDSGSTLIKSPHIFFGNRIIYVDNFCDTIFCIDEKFNFIPYVVFNYGKYSLTPNIIQSKTAKEFSAQTAGFIYQYYLLVDAKNFIFFNCRLGKYYPESESEIYFQINGLELEIKFARGLFNMNDGSFSFVSNYR